METTTTCDQCGDSFTRHHVAYKPPRFCSRACSVRARSTGWRMPDGRIKIGEQFRARLVWNETHPNDPLLPGEVIHHVNGVKDDDRPENLQKLASQATHAALHFAGIPKTPEHVAKQAAAQRARTDRIRPPRPCDHCGNPLSRQQMRDRGRFCSHTCHYTFRKGKGRSGW